MSTATQVVERPQIGISEATDKRNRSARKRSKPVKSSIPAGAANTPGAMVPEQAKAAWVSPEAIDYTQVLQRVMFDAGKQGDGYGDSVVTKKGQNHVFSMACKAVKSMIGQEAKDEHGVPTRLPEPYAVEIRKAIVAVLSNQYNRVLTYGGPNVEDQDIRFVWDKPWHVVVDSDKSGLKDKDGKPLADLKLGWKVTMTAKRGNRSIGEAILCANAILRGATKRLENMDLHPEKYDAKQVRATKDLIHLSLWKLGQLEREKALALKKATAISVLDGELANGTVTQDEYANQRKLIESATE